MTEDFRDALPLSSTEWKKLPATNAFDKVKKHPANATDKGGLAGSYFNSVLETSSVSRNYIISKI